MSEGVSLGIASPSTSRIKKKPKNQKGEETIEKMNKEIKFKREDPMEQRCSFLWGTRKKNQTKGMTSKLDSS